MKWQPIATAPKDGTSALLFVDGQGEDFNQIVVGHWHHSRDYYGKPADYWTPTCDSGMGLHLVTHWMPLPDNP